MEATQIPMREFLKDPVFRKHFRTKPVLLPSSGPHPFWLYLQPKEGGPWKRAKLTSYNKGFDYVKTRLNDLYDFAICSRQRTYLPPVHRPVDEDGNPGKHREYWANYPRNHSWCPYCRRPTIFRAFEKHHALTEINKAMGLSLVPREPEVRCTICGIREEAVKPWVKLGRTA